MAEQTAIRCAEAHKLQAVFDAQGLRFHCKDCRIEHLLLWSDLDRFRQNPGLTILVCGEIILSRADTSSN